MSHVTDINDCSTLLNSRMIMSYTDNDHVLLAYLLHKIYKDVTFGKAKRSFNSSPAPVIGQLKKANESASYQELSRSKNNATSNGFVR